MVKFYDEKSENELYVKIDNRGVYICDREGSLTALVVYPNGTPSFIPEKTAEAAGIFRDEDGYACPESLSLIIAHLLKKLNKLEGGNAGFPDTLMRMLEEFKNTEQHSNSILTVDEVWIGVCHKYLKEWYEKGYHIPELKNAHRYDKEN